MRSRSDINISSTGSGRFLVNPRGPLSALRDDRLHCRPEHLVELSVDILTLGVADHPVAQRG